MWQLCVHKQGTRRPERAGDSPGGTGLGPGRTARSSVPLCSRHVVARDWGHPTTSQSKKQARMETADRRFANPSRTPPRARLRNVLPSPSRSVCSLAGGHFPLLPGSCRRVQRSQQWPGGLESAGSQAREPPAPPELDPSAKGCASQTVLGPGCTSPATGAGCIGRRVRRQPGGDASEGRGVRADARAEGGTPGLPGGVGAGPAWRVRRFRCVWASQERSGSGPRGTSGPEEKVRGSQCSRGEVASAWRGRSPSVGGRLEDRGQSPQLQARSAAGTPPPSPPPPATGPALLRQSGWCRPAPARSDPGGQPGLRAAGGSSACCPWVSRGQCD